MMFVKMTRNIRETIIPDFKDKLGIEPTYYRQPYILSSSRK